MDIEKRLARRARGKEPSPIRAIFPLMSIPGMISFGGGYPNPETFPFLSMDLFFKGGRGLTLDGAEMKPALQYGPSDSDPSLLAQLLEWHQTKDGIELSKDRIVVLNGSQEGLFICAYLFLESDDSIVVSEPTYPGALSAFGSFTHNFVPIPLDEKGMNTEELEKRLENIPRPKLIYTIPSGHNPGGVSLSLERRQHLLEIARRYDLLVVEDDPYQLVRLDEAPPPPSLQSMDRDGRVIRLDSFSKIFAPGLRIGYASGAPNIMEQIVLFKQSANLHTGSLAQHILAAYIGSATVEGFRADIREKCELYRAHRDAMVEAARKHLPEEVRFNVPGEGMFIWFELPDGCQSSRMLEKDGKELKVVLVPGPAFSSQGGLQRCMRASFSMVNREQIEEGMKRFAEMIRRDLAR